MYYFPDDQSNNHMTEKVENNTTNKIKMDLPSLGHEGYKSVLFEVSQDTISFSGL